MTASHFYHQKNLKKTKANKILEDHSPLSPVWGETFRHAEGKNRFFAFLFNYFDRKKKKKRILLSHVKESTSVKCPEMLSVLLSQSRRVAV